MGEPQHSEFVTQSFILNALFIGPPANLVSEVSSNGRRVVKTMTLQKGSSSLIRLTVPLNEFKSAAV